MEKLETPPSIFEVIMQGEENVNLEDIIPTDFPDHLPIIPSCVSEDLENICRDLDVEEEIVSVFEDNPTTQSSATIHTFEGPSNSSEKPKTATTSTTHAFEGPSNSSYKPETAPTSSNTFEELLPYIVTKS